MDIWLNIWSTKLWYIISGITVNLKYTFLSVSIGLLLGVVIATCKVSRFRALTWLANTYTSAFRGTPLMIQLFIIYYAIPVSLTAFQAGVIAFSLNSSAYISEIIRAGITTVDIGQFEAAQVLGVSKFYTMRDIILPQAIRKILPSLINELINMTKETAIISMIGEEDIIRRAYVIASESYNFFIPMCTAAATYYIVVLIMTSIAGAIEKKLVL